MLSSKFQLIFPNIVSYYQKADLNVLFQSLFFFFFKTFLTKFPKHTLTVMFLFQCNFLLVVKIRLSKLTVMLLFQCNFLLVVGADNLVWQVYFYRILSTWCWINTKVYIGFTIPSPCTQTFLGIRRVNVKADEYAVICW